MSSKASSRSKNNKKRKTGTPDLTQGSLDRFLSSPSQARDDPMQIDTATTPVKPNLGTFRQQSLLPTIVIHNLNTLRPKELPADYFEKSWAKQNMFITAVFTNNSSSDLNFITISKLAENLCRFGKAETVYRGLTKEFENHVKKIQIELLSVPLNQQLLVRLNHSWKTFCSQLSIIRNVYMELDRTYILPNTQYTSIVQLGKRIFSDVILDVSEFRNIVIAEVLETIKQERDGQTVDTTLIKDVLQMLLELAFYNSDFEPKFIQSTSQYYKEESNRLIQNMTAPDYIQHVAQRCQEESENKIKRYLDKHTKQPLTSTVIHQLIYSKTDVVIKKGFDSMMDQQQYEPLKMFYQLLENSLSLNLLRDAFGHYIKTQGVALVANSPADPSMIVQLLKFKKKMDKATKACFGDDPLFVNASKESFEYFINTRGNKPAELLAKFIDAKLKLYTKKQRTGGKETDLNALDSALVLFRFIQGKDVFEVYYKRFLAKRLLLDRSSSNDLENHVLEGLKRECGQDFTKNLESMFHDIQVSSDLDAAFKDFKKKQQVMPVHVKVIAQGTWPTYPVSDIRLSSEMLATQKSYEQFYTTKFKGRKLIWQNALSSCTLAAHYPKGTKEITVSLSQAVILCLFNNTKKSFSVNEIQQATHLSRKDVLGLLLSISTGSHKLIVNESGKETIAQGDKFRFNEAFESETVKIRVPPASVEQVTEETKDVEQKVHINRQHQLEAAIVRIMKAKKTISHDALMTALMMELKYTCEPNTVKMRIESLIDRDYLIRDPNNYAFYVYQA